MIQLPLYAAAPPPPLSEPPFPPLLSQLPGDWGVCGGGVEGFGWGVGARVGAGVLEVGGGGGSDDGGGAFGGDGFEQDLIPVHQIRASIVK